MRKSRGSTAHGRLGMAWLQWRGFGIGPAAQAKTAGAGGSAPGSSHAPHFRGARGPAPWSQFAGRMAYQHPPGPPLLGARIADAGSPRWVPHLRAALPLEQRRPSFTAPAPALVPAPQPRHVQGGSGTSCTDLLHTVAAGRGRALRWRVRGEHGAGAQVARAQQAGDYEGVREYLQEQAVRAYNGKVRSTEDLEPGLMQVLCLMPASCPTPPSPLFPRPPLPRATARPPAPCAAVCVAAGTRVRGPLLRRLRLVRYTV